MPLRVADVAATAAHNPEAAGEAEVDGQIHAEVRGEATNMGTQGKPGAREDGEPEK